MALSSGATAHIVDAAANAIVPRNRNTNPLPNKVIHADIRIQSIDDEPKLDGEASESDQLVAQSKPVGEDADYREKAAEMQNWWTESIAMNMDLPDGYSKVAVLLIRWADELDELRTGQEAQELDALFRDRFHYSTKTVELNVRRKPQHQLERHISDFICEHDGPHNLLIVYYTGHGVYHEEKKCLELTGSLRPMQDRGFGNAARAEWNQVENRLKREDVDSDVLTILDTCYSSNLVKSGREENKKFELLSACAIDQVTASPGKNSFTRALIDAIHALLKIHGEHPFSTFRINQHINLDKRRTDTPSILWGRVQNIQQNDSHIFLAPLKPPVKDASQNPVYRPMPKGYLTLRFGLRDATLNREQIEYMTRTLARKFNNSKGSLVGLRRADWVDIRPAPPMSPIERVVWIISVIARWKKAAAKRREERESSQRTVDEVTFPESMDVDSTTTSQKRAHDGMDGLPDPKRQYLDTSHPPSPPVSDSSRIDYDT